MNPDPENVVDEEEVDDGSVLSRWEPAGLLASFFFVALPVISAILLVDYAVFLLSIWAVWAIYLSIRGTGINRMAGTRLLIGCILGLLYWLFLAPPPPPQ